MHPHQEYFKYNRGKAYKLAEEILGHNKLDKYIASVESKAFTSK
jgi:hypothetical protein